MPELRKGCRHVSWWYCWLVMHVSGYVHNFLSMLSLAVHPPCGVWRTTRNADCVCIAMQRLMLSGMIVSRRCRCSQTQRNSTKNIQIHCLFIEVTVTLATNNQVIQFLNKYMSFILGDCTITLCPPYLRGIDWMTYTDTPMALMCSLCSYISHHYSELCHVALCPTYPMPYIPWADNLLCYICVRVGIQREQASG